MTKKIAALVTALVFGGLASAHAAAEISVRLQTVEGRNQVIRGSRPEITSAAEKFAENGEYEFARTCYAKLIETDPTDVRALLLMGQLYQFKLGKYADAVRTYKRAEHVVPEANKGGRAFIWRLTAEAYRELAEKTNSLIYFVQAISEYEKILDYFDPKDVEVMYQIGSCRLNSRDYEGAITWFKRSIETDPKGEWAEYSRKALQVAEQEDREKKGRN